MPAELQSTEAKQNYQSRLLRRHIIACWIVVAVNPIGGLKDFASMPEYFSQFFLIRISVSLLTALIVVFRNKLKIRAEVLGFIPFLLLILQFSYMWSVMDIAFLIQNSLTFISVFLGAGILLVWDRKYSIAIAILSLMATIIFFLSFSGLSFVTIMMHGGILVLIAMLISMYGIHQNHLMVSGQVATKMKLDEKINQVEEAEAMLRKRNRELEQINAQLESEISSRKKTQSELVQAHQRELDRQKTEFNALKKLEQRFRLLTESVKGYAFFMTNASFAIRSWNAGGMHLYQYDSNEIIDRDLGVLFDPVDFSAGILNAIQVESEQNGVYRKEMIQMRKDQSRFIASLVITPLHDDRETLRGFAIIAGDITRQKEQESKLKEREEMYRSLAETASDLILTIDEQSRIVYSNNICEKMFGYKKEELIGESLTLLMPAYFREKHLRGLKSYLQTGVKNISWQSTEITGLHKNGNEIPIEVSFSEVLRDGKKYFTGIIRDITERKKADEMLRLTFEAAPNALILSEVNGNIVLVNRQAEILFGFERNEMTGININKLVPEKIKNEFSYFQEKYLSNPVIIQIGSMNDLYMVNKSGREFPVEIGINPIQTEKRVMLLSSIIDITERKRMESFLNETNEKYRLAFSTNPIPMLVADVETLSIIDANEAACRVFGYHLDDFLNLSMLDLFPMEEMPEELKSVFEIKFFKKMKTYQSRLREFSKLVRSSGEIINVELHVFRISISGHPANIIQAIDVSQREKEEMQLREAKMRAEDLAESKQNFVAAMSHEIRTPLYAIQATVDFLSKEMTQLERKEHLQELKFATDNLLYIINNILDYSKIDAGKLQLDLSPFNLKKLIHQISNTFRNQALQKGLNLMHSCSEKIPETLVGDSFHLTQILNNLINNAIKFTSKGTITLSASLINTSGQYASVFFKVSDTGIGIPLNRQQRIFESFAQADSAVSKSFGGTGLGLAISKKLVSLMGGTLSLRSEPGKGSDFFFTLDLAKSAESNAVSVIEFSNTEAKLNGIKILLAEDNDTNRKIIKRTLENWSATVEAVENGQLAVNVFPVFNPHIILMDMQMPVIDGITASSIIRKKEITGNQVPIIAITAFPEDQFKSQIDEAGINDVLVKPINSKTLLHKIIFHLNRHDVLDEFEFEEEETEGIDEMIKQFNNNPEFLHQYLETMIKEVKRIPENIFQLLNKKDFSALNKYIHKILPTAKRSKRENLIQSLLALKNNPVVHRETSKSFDSADPILQVILEECNQFADQLIALKTGV